MSAGSLVHQRCWHHPGREAVVRCPECRRFYCRECVTEHSGRMMCASCVAALTQASAKAEREPVALWIAAAAAGLLLAWMIFYYMGAFLARIPSDYFAGSQ